MKSFESDIHKLAEKTRLKAVEREMVRERILTYMEYHPLKKEAMGDSVQRSLTEREFVYIHFNTPFMKFTAAALAVVLLVGVPLLAERTVPGDALYLVKTGINETIRTQLAVSPYEKVQLETELMGRRIAEARLLAVEGKLTKEVEAEIAETVKDHAQAVQSGLAQLREDDKEGAAIAEIAFNSALEVQSAVLGETNDASSTQGSTILEVVNTVRNEVASGEQIALSYDNLIAHIESETTRSYELFLSIKASATAEETDDIERRLEDINRSITEAKSLYETDEVKAIAELKNVLGLVQKLITFMTDIDVRETVALEALVPVKLTIDERRAFLTAVTDDVASRTRAVGIAIASSSEPLDEGVMEKVALGLLQINELLGGIPTLIDESTIDSAEAVGKEANALIHDIELLIAMPTPTQVPEPESILGTDDALPEAAGGATTTSEYEVSETDDASTTTTPELGN